MNGDLKKITDSATNQVTQLTYDQLGHLKVFISPTKHVRYTIDAFDRRIYKKDGNNDIQVIYEWNTDDQLVATLDGSQVLDSIFVYASQAHSPDYMIKGNVNYHIVKDHLGSPVQVINASTGAIVQEVKYDEWGNILSDTNPGFTPFGFAGCLYDQDTKLCRFGARDYDASVGRWLSKDPILFEGQDTNLYGYVMQDPINWIDPTGEVLFAPIIGGALVGGGFDLASQLLQNGGNLSGVDWGSVGQSAAIGGALGGFGRLLGPFTTRGLPGGLQRIRRFIRFDRPHHGKGYGFDGLLGKHLNTPAKLSPLLGLEGDSCKME